MNKDSFMQFIADNRDCEQFLLDAAISKGLYKAKNDKLDSKKFFMLAAACVLTFALCISVILTPLQAVSEIYYQNRHKVMPGSEEVLDGYLNAIASNFKRFIGEE